MWYQKKQNRYGNVAQSTEHGGLVYHSKKEAAYAQELDLRVKAKDISSWQRQIRLPLDVNGFHICDYIIDFKIAHVDDTVEYVEVKGFETEVWRLKWKLFEAIYSIQEPEAMLTVVR